MRLSLRKNDGELLATWTMPDTVTEAEVDTLIGEGLWQKCRLDRCDECGAFFPHAELVERHDAHGPACLCRTCGGESDAAPDQP
jgi:hypothetical protein